MAWIKMIEEDEATSEIREFYDRLKQQSGGVANVIKINSLHPPLMYAQTQYFTTLMYGRSPLSRARREMIALVVSARNQCHY